MTFDLAATGRKLIDKIQGAIEGRRPRIGVALGSGAARGWAHLGVLQALDEAGIPIDMIAGTSAGSIAGAAYAAGTINELRDYSMNISWMDLVRYFGELPQRSGLISGRHISQFLGRFIPVETFEELDIPFACMATDLLRAQPVVLREGDLQQAIRASMSMPGVFTPVTFEDTVLVDGGIMDPVPVRAVRAMGADFVIAVDVNYGGMTPPQKQIKLPPAERGNLIANIQAKLPSFDMSLMGSKPGEEPHMLDILTHSLRIMEGQISENILGAAPPDILVRPDLSNVAHMEFNRLAEVMQTGYDEAMQLLSDFHGTDVLAAPSPSHAVGVPQ